MAEYRKRDGSDTWHFCSNCSNWPTRPTKYTSRYTKPTSGELCNECIGKKDSRNCS